MMKLRYQFVIVLLTCFVVFSPAINGELITGDDEDLFSRLQNLPSIDVKGQFFRSSSSLLYYRPISNITYQLDQVAWGLNSEIMHLENILIHVFCAILVLLLTYELLPQDRRLTSRVPLVAALLFAVHPLTSEPVNWISGRYDLLAGFFLLLSALLLLKYREKRKLVIGGGAFCAFVLATFCKEVAVAFLPGALCLLFAKRTNLEGGDRVDLSRQGGSGKSRGLWISLWLSGAFLVYLLMRFAAQVGHSGKIGRTLSIIFSDLWYSTFVCLRGIGFYFKKLFLPLPLNFAIINVDPLYEILGIPAVILVVYLIYRRSIRGAYVVTGAFLVTPSFLLMFNQIAWTTYAERYLYIPLAFICPAVCVYFENQLRSLPKFLRLGVPSVVIFFLVVISYGRSEVWSKNLSLWKDTVEKSPRHAQVINDYGIALYNQGQIKDAIEQFRDASNFIGFRYRPIYEINLATTLMKAKRWEESRDAFISVLEKDKGKKNKAVNGIEDLYAAWIADVSNVLKKQELKEELKGILEKYNESDLN